MLDDHDPGLAWPKDVRLRTERRAAPPNSILIRAGEKEPRIRVIVAGWAYRYRMLDDGRRQILYLLLPGDACGLETIYGQPVESAVRASTAVVYLALDNDDLLAAFETSSTFRRCVFSTLIAERSALETSFVRLGQCDATERTAAFLTGTYARLERAGLAADNSFQLAISQQEVADLLGLHNIHLNRVLIRLRTQKLISIEKEVVALLDLGRLSDLVSPLAGTDLMPWMLSPDQNGMCFNNPLPKF